MAAISKQYYVYFYIDPFTGLEFYVGKGIGNRCHKHLYETKEKTCNIHKFNKIQSIFKKGSVPIVLLKHENLYEEDALKIEEIYIRRFGKIIDKTGCLTNIKNGGDCSLMSTPEIVEKISGKNHYLFGKTRSESSKQKQSKSKTGTKQTQEWCDNHSIFMKTNSPMLGKTPSKETKKKQSDAKLGKPLPIETRINMSKAKKGKPLLPATLLAAAEASRNRVWTLEQKQRMFLNNPMSKENIAKRKLAALEAENQKKSA